MIRIVRARRFTSRHSDTASFWKKISSTVFCCVPQIFAAMRPTRPRQKRLAKLQCR
jgi:hypothetical protein